ncbi:MAG TPA: hypothetical protein VG347_22060 [Verrucomicrobiae bacterium]|nr:hypothetical protein [Verrucomicrobiae bacterium]
MKTRGITPFQIILAFLILIGLPQMSFSSDATNHFSIHLQDGFVQNREVVIQVDGHEIYKGVPQTSPVLGLAKEIPVLAATEHPTVSFTISSTQIGWTNQIDLKAGSVVGFSLATNGAVIVQQAKSFSYD